MRTARFAIAALALVVLASACSSEPEAVEPIAVPTGSVAPTPGPSIYPVPGEEESPAPEQPTQTTGSPEPVEIRGESTATVTGSEGINLALDFDSIDPYSYYGGAGGESGLTFMSGPNVLSIGGTLRKGPQKTSPTAALTLHAPGDADQPTLNFISGNGSCVINLVEAGANGFSGTYRCARVKVEKGFFVTLSGTFSGEL